MRHVYLSPHLDDVVLSCGGAVLGHVARGDSVQVISVFAADCNLEALSFFAEFQHALWGGVPMPFAMRRCEDRAALGHLGAEWLHLGYWDAIYRAGSGEWLYADLDRLFGDIQPSDALGKDGSEGLASHLACLIPHLDGMAVYAPLSVGRHVDHQIVHAAARRLESLGYRVAYYEDYPYAEKQGATAAALDAAGAEDWRVEMIDLDETDLAAKVAAVACYRSQIVALFGEEQALPERVRAFSESFMSGEGLAERVWWPSG